MKTNRKETLAVIQNIIYVLNGGEGSGNFDHAGRPGEVGGSASEKSGTSTKARVLYQPTEKQKEKWMAYSEKNPMPDDEYFKELWKKTHHGKEKGWGLQKRQYILGSMTSTYEYQTGIWQGRVDAIRGLDYQDKIVDDENANAYNLGYYRGYKNFTSDWKGLDPASKERLESYENK